MKLHGCFLFLFLAFTTSAYNQTRRALIIGINNYYSAPNIVSEISLAGAVNDAMAIKSIITARFGFKENEIKTLFNEQATKANIIQNMEALAASSKRGDVVFIYYAGHGVLLHNSLSPKGGLNQGILASDIYTRSTSLIRDNDQKRWFNKMIDNGAIVTVLYDCCFSAGNAKASYLVQEIDTIGQSRSVLLDVPYEEDRSQDTSDQASEGTRSIPNTVQDIKDKTYVSKPEDKKDSKFLFMAATTDREESKEKRDINNMPHGVFTAAFVRVMNRNKTTISSQQLYNEIKEELKRQFAEQQPIMYGDAARYKMNLVGSDPTGFSDTTRVTVREINNNTLILSGGASVGMAKGNLLRGTGTSKNIMLRVAEVTGMDKAIATVIKGNAKNVKSGAVFELVNHTSISTPRLKVYLPKDVFPLSAYNTFVQQVINPAVKEDGFIDYNSFKWENLDYVYYHNNKWVADYWKSGEKKAEGGSSTIHAMFLQKERQQSFANKNITFTRFREQVVKTGAIFYFIYLPVPSEIYAALKSKMAGNQNIEFVQDPARADVALYCAADKDGVMHFLCSRELIGNKCNTDGIHYTEQYDYAIKGYQINKQAVTTITNGLQELILHTASFRGWLNNDLKTTP